MSFAVGSLVRARGREWVVLPDGDAEVVLVRPLGGTEDETTGICTALEPVESATFELPNPSRLGDWRSCRLLRDAVRLGFRSSAGPFRSFGRLGVEPRPYQLVPLLMAMKQDPVRLLIADDVGIGKTVEACLVARELLDRGEVRRLAVLCPPHLAEQWQRELKEKFHIDAELVLASTATRLEQACPAGQSVFDVFPFVVVSMDFIKSDRRRDDFLRACPELVIVDEAHTCTYAAPGNGRIGRHQRYQLVKALAKHQARHLILVTATPHSGNEQAFRSLLSILSPDLDGLPEDLAGPANEPHRRRLAQYLVQRRRGDIRHYLQLDTPFPDRQEKEEQYKLAPDYKRLFARVLNYARETVGHQGEQGAGFKQQRVRWWSALALLRSLASSPAAAAATLRNRAATVDADSADEVDQIGQRTVLDLVNDEPDEGMDVTPGADAGDTADSEEQRHRRRLLELAREAEALHGPEKDEKLKRATKLVKELLDDGFRPIIFCRFIDTAVYVAEQLRKSLPKAVTVEAVTGLVPPAEREARVEQLAKADRPVLVCTDCLSEGINLQSWFNAVFHYDLSWNPTRHEQREGRVDRYGQPTKQVRVLTYYGVDNQIDGIVLDVLLRKHRSIRTSLGISVPVPVDTEKVIEAIFEGLLLRGKDSADIQQMPLFDEEVLEPVKLRVHHDWEAVADREKRSRTMFAQETIKVDAVARELAEVQNAIGSGADVARFTQEAMDAHGATLVHKSADVVHFDVTHLPAALRDALSVAGLDRKELDARFQLPVNEGVLYLNRTHPIVEKLAGHVMDTALDPKLSTIGSRAGVIRTTAVQRRTTLLLLRFRYQLITSRGGAERPMLAEDCQLVGFTGAPDKAEWLDPLVATSLLWAEPEANVDPDQARDYVQKVIDGMPYLRPRLETAAEKQGAELLAAHERVREAARLRGNSRVEAKLPPDVLGIYVYLPAPSGRVA